nr:hypothetical protein [Brucella sp. 10RB9213]
MIQPSRKYPNDPAGVQVKADRIKINVRRFLFACKVLEFLGQKKAKGQIPASARPPEEPQFKTESQA